MRYSTFLYSYWIGLHVYFKKAILHLKRAKGVFISFGDCTSGEPHDILKVNIDLCHLQKIHIK